MMMTSSSRPSSEVDKKSSSYRYGREEMLAMYAPGLPVPTDLRDMTIFCMRELLPMSFLPVTEDEQTALLKCVNSDLAVHSNQRGAVPQQQGARTVPGGQKRGRGRGRGDASLRNSKANDGRSETSESVGSVDWRKEKSAAEKTMTTMSGGASSSYGGGGGGGSAVARATSKSESSESSGGYYESDSGGEIQAVQCTEDRLSCVAAASSSEEVNLKMSDVREQRCIVTNSTNRIDRNNTISDQLDRRKLDPTTKLSYDSVVIASSVNSNSRRDHVITDDQRLSQLVHPSTDTKHCGGDAQRLSVNYAKDNVVIDSNVLSSSSYGEGFCGDVSRTNVRGNGVAWSNPVCSRASEDDQRNGSWTGDPANETWFYKDPIGDVQGVAKTTVKSLVSQCHLIITCNIPTMLLKAGKSFVQNGSPTGPFKSHEMEEWFLMGFFPMKLFIRPSQAEEFVLLGDLIKAFGRVPFLSKTARKDISHSREQPVLTDQSNHRHSRPVSVLPFHQQFVPPHTAYSLPSFLPEAMAPPQLHNQRQLLETTHLSSAASVASRDSGWPYNSSGGLNSQIEGNSMSTVDREKIEDDLKKRIEKQLKEKMMLEMERENLRQEQQKIEEERRLMMEHQHLLEDEKKRQDERRKMEDERRQLEEERRKLEELHRKAEEERRLQEHIRMERHREEQEMRMIGEERKLLEQQRLELERLHRKAEGDHRRALQQLQELSDESFDDDETIVSDETKDSEAFRGKMWCTWKEASGDQGDDDQLHEESALARLEDYDDGRREWRENDTGSEKDEKLVEASESFGPSEELNSGERGISLKNVNETKKKLVAWNSSSKNDADKQCAPSSPVVKCPWATTWVTSAPPPSSTVTSSKPSTTDSTVDVTRQTKDVDPTLTLNCDTTQMKQQRLTNIQEQKKQMSSSFNWNEQKTTDGASGAQSRVLSFLEIQKEQARQEREEEKKRKQQLLHQQQQQVGKVPIKMKPQKPPPAAIQPPRRIKAAAGAVAAKADAPTVSSSGSSLPGAPPSGSSGSGGSGSVPGLMSVPGAPAVPFAAQPWNPMQGPPMSPAAEMKEFMVWCHRALPTASATVDAPTLIEFLKDVESPYELYDYVRLYLGESKQAMDFAHEFLERRRRVQMRMNRTTVGYHFATAVYPSIAFGCQPGMFYQSCNGNLTLQPDKAKGQKMML